MKFFHGFHSLSTYCHKHVLASRYYPYNERHESTANKSRAQSKNSTSKREYDIPRACKTFLYIKKRAKEIYYRKLKKQQALYKSWIFSHQQGRLDRIYHESEMNNYK